MKQITVFPLKGFTFENREISFGATRQEVSQILGEPDDQLPPLNEIENTYIEYRDLVQFEYNGDVLTGLCIPFFYTVCYNGISLKPDFAKALMQKKPVMEKCVFFSPLRWGYIEEAGLLFRYSDHRCDYFIKDSDHIQLTLQGLELIQKCEIKAMKKEQENGKNI